jgi:hypothetical protein
MRMTAVVLTSLFLVSLAEARPIPDKLAGVWRFVSEVNRHADGSVAVVGPSEGYEGQLIYTTGGHFSVQLMPRGRKWTPETASVLELRETAAAGTAYFGQYRVDAASHTVTHDVTASLDPSVERLALVRKFKLDVDALVLSGTWEFGGETLMFELTWKRLE